MSEARVQSDLGFRLMSMEFRIRDILSPPEKRLREIGLKPGMTVLDFGCGPGGYTLAAARLVGEGGRVYALDIHPLAISSVSRAAERLDLSHVEVLHADSIDQVPDGSVDIVLLYDVLHELQETAGIFNELCRLLKPGGFLSLSDHHLKEASILSIVTADSRFRFCGERSRAFRFEPVLSGSRS